MNIRKDGTKLAPFYSFILAFIVLALGSCGTPSSGTQNGQTVAISTQATLTPTPFPTPSPMPTPTPSPTPTPTPSPTPIAGLQGPTDFLLNNTLTFSNASGNSIVSGAALSTSVVQTGVSSNLQHTLFVVDSNNNVTVYTNVSTSPIQAQVSQNADGSTNIQYTESLNSGTTFFHGTLSGNQMSATSSGETIGGTTVNDQTFIGGTKYTATFTTQVNWISPDQIPPPPISGNYQFTADGGVNLSWLAGGTTQKYDIYRFILTDNQGGYQFLASTSATYYTDESALTLSNAQTIAGISYAIYAVGAAGVENPQDILIPVSSLG